MIFTTSQLFFSLFFIIHRVSYGADTLAVNQYLSGNQTLVSPAGNFEMGFFKPGKSPKYYIGIWYIKAKTPQTVVWVANRETPVSDIFSSKLKIRDGNLVLVDKSNNEIWSTNMISTVTNSASISLLDDGNLVMRYGSSSSPPLWQSFDHPTHTWLPGSKFKFEQPITSWRNTEDPAPGLYSLEVDPNKKQFLLKWNRSLQYWTSGSWDGQIFSLVPEMLLNYIYNFSYIDNANESYCTYSVHDSSVIARFILDVSGQMRQLSWLEGDMQWNLFWAQPRQFCEVYAACGPFSACNQASLPFCNCLTGFEPSSQSDWDLQDFSGGCVRKSNLSCKVKDEKPGFILTYVPVRSISPFSENENLVSDESACRSFCLIDCTCYAYTVVSKQCRRWNDETLNEISLHFISYDLNRQKFPINIKVSSSNLPRNAAKINTKVLIAGIVSGFLGLVFLCSIVFIFYKRVKGRDPGILSEEDRKNLDVPFFEFKKILSATENFSPANKLGQGGFGPVYKGMLPDGAEIAVKRLSSRSRQGSKEFKNEVVLIAKLQHRNLVRLLGYSLKDHEMILLYEYMPNKSLDRFIFDRTLCMRLDWALRFDIIMGIARGLVYLHQDSRLRIIHRDLKASNVLLDKDMNPKISDFGLAKIVKGRDAEASTTRVIGTYGYMAPEYALDGLFSVKSDVFSFGVVVLEIISGKRNTGYYNNQQSFSLISNAWGLWKDRKPLDVVDPALAESCSSIEVLRCMIIGLLCIQEDPQDRPTMTNVVLMLGMDIESLPEPKEPAFVSKTRILTSLSLSTESEINQLTITEEAGR